MLRRLHVLAALTRSDLLIRYGRGPWQIVNWLVNPFALVGIYLLLRVILGRGGNEAALSIACAVVPLQIVIMGFESAMGAVALRAPVIDNRAVDRTLLPPSSVLTEGIAFRKIRVSRIPQAAGYASCASSGLSPYRNT